MYQKAVKYHMEKRATYWPRGHGEEYLIDCRGRTCIVNQVGKVVPLVSFDGIDGFYLIPKSDLYFSDHPAGYNQFN